MSCLRDGRNVCTDQMSRGLVIQRVEKFSNQFLAFESARTERNKYS